MRHYDAVIFDLDGTLLDTSEGIYKSVTYAIDTLGFEKIPSEVLRTFIGPPTQNSFARVYGLEKEEADKPAVTEKPAEAEKSESEKTVVEKTVAEKVESKSDDKKEDNEKVSE